MVITANIATYPSRELLIPKMLNSINRQGFDEIRLHINDRENYTLTDDQLYALGVTKITTASRDLADNGKFISIRPGERAFTMDDDLEYPQTYKDDMSKAIDRLGCIVTHHGRPRISLPIRHYYTGIKPVIPCLKQNSKQTPVLIAGTGVTAWDTDYFLPDIWHSEDLYMSDVLFSHQAVLEMKQMIILPHRFKYFNYIPAKYKIKIKCIHTTVSKTETKRQIELATEIAKMSRKPFRHFLLTRYNTGLYDENNPYKKNAPDPERWMEDRFELFKATATSVARQTCPDFKWFIFVDPATPSAWRQKIEEVSGAETIDKPINEFMPTLKRDRKFLITTRFDNDDLLKPRFIEMVQRHFEPSERVIDTGGEQYDSRNGRLYTRGRTTPNSPFISLVEEWTDSPKTAFYKTHSKMNSLFPARYVDEVLWTQVIHGNNVANRITGKSK